MTATEHKRGATIMKKIRLSKEMIKYNLDELEVILDKMGEDGNKAKVAFNTGLCNLYDLMQYTKNHKE